MATEFNTEQFVNAYSDGAENSMWNLARKRVILNYIHKYKLNHILDIGCGRGIVTSYLHKAGLSITGVDLGSPDPANNAGANIIYNTNAVELPEATRAQSQAILLLDVIEHIENPVKFLKDINTAFPNVEHLLITVPARAELWTNFDDYYGHFRRYTLVSLKKELKDAGFEIEFNRYFFHFLYLGIRLNNLVVRKRKIDLNPRPGILSKYINRIMATLFYLETFIIPGKLVGSSIICICKRIEKR